MARPYEYSRSRYILMQVVMWVILLASVGVAALVSRFGTNNGVPLGSPRAIGPISIQLPKGWRVVEDQTDGEPTIFATERTRAPLIRRLQIVVHQRSPLDLLSDVLSKTTGATIPYGDARGGRMSIQRLAPGELLIGGKLFGRQQDAGMEPVLISARGQLPGDSEVIVILVTVGELGVPEPEDPELVGAVAASVKLISRHDGPQLRER